MIFRSLVTIYKSIQVQNSLQQLGYGLDSPRFESRQRKEIFPFSKLSMSETGPTMPLFKGCWSSFPEVKRPGLEENHSLLSSDKVKNERIYNSNPLIRLHGADRKKLTLTSAA